MTIVYKIKFFSYWHTGSGLSGGAETSLRAIKDEDGLPFIPGKTLKGLLREAATNINSLSKNLVKQDFIDILFGLGEDRHEDGRFSPGQCFFSNATLSEYLTQELAMAPSRKKHLFTNMAFTSIDEHGLAKDKTLRQVEFTVPLTLYATLVDFPSSGDSLGQSDDNLEQLKTCFKWVKKLGSNRNRGFGRCEFSHYKSVTE